MQSLVDGLLDAGADIETGQFVIPYVGKNAVGKKNIYQLIIRIYPSTSTREARMAIHRCGCLLTTRTAARIATIGFVKAKPPATGARQSGREHPACLRTQVTMPTQSSPVQQHLIEQCLLMGVGEKSCIASHSAKECRRLVVDKALQGIFAQEIIDR